jgi:hypothetical protein
MLMQILCATKRSIEIQVAKKYFIRKDCVKAIANQDKENDF